LLDFGIGKLLAAGDPADSDLTRLAGPALTPDYASPEHIAGTPVTTASDVYSLGVMLYELLAGRKPYTLQREAGGGFEAAMLKTEPRRPSEVAIEPAARKALRGDLDTIVMKALKKG